MKGRGVFARRRGTGPSTGAGRDRTAAAPAASGEANGGAEEGFLVEDHDGLLLLRTFSDDTLTPADVADLARTMRADEDTVTVIAGVEGAGSAAFWPKLSELLDTLSESGADSVRLVMPGAGLDVEGRPATARRIADAWRMEVEAPDGPPLVVPGGSLFIPSVEGAGRRSSAGAWWRFAPGKRPEPLGPRSPQPSWQSALDDLPSALAGGCVVEQIPAGVLVRPSGAAPARPGDLYHAVPVDPRRLTVVVGVPFGEDISAEEVAEVLEALPDDVQVDVRLVPGGRRDLLPLAQSVSDRLDIDVEVMTGLPLVAAAGLMGTYSVRSVLATPDGTPAWIPFVDAVRCSPPDAEGRARPPRLLRWSPPLPGPARPEEGVVGLTDDWQLTVTRAGMWVGPRGGPALSPTARRVDPAGPMIELGMPGELLDASLWPVLSNVLESLAPDLRGRTVLHVHGVARDGGRELRRLAAQYGLRTLRHAAPAPVRARQQTAPDRPAAAGAVAPSGATTVASLSPPPHVRGTERPASSGPAERAGQGPRTQSGQPAVPHQPGRASGAPPAPPAKIGGRAARTERARELREAMAAGTETGAGERASAATGAGTSGTTSASAPSGTPGRRGPSGARPAPGTPTTANTPGTSGAPGTAGTAATSGTPAGPATSGTAGTSGTRAPSGAPGTSAPSGGSGVPGTSAPSGKPTTSATSGTPVTPGKSGASGRSAARGERERRADTFDWSDDRVPTGFAGRARSSGTTAGPALGTCAAPTPQAPERNTGPSGRPEAREPEANAPEAEVRAAGRDEDPARPPGLDEGGRAGAAAETGSDDNGGAAETSGPDERAEGDPATDVTTGNAATTDGPAAAEGSEPEGGQDRSGAERKDPAPGAPEGPDGEGSPSADAGSAPPERPGEPEAGGASTLAPEPGEADDEKTPAEAGAPEISAVADGPAAAPTPKPSTGPDSVEVAPAAPRSEGPDVRDPEPAPAPPGPPHRVVAESSDPVPATAPLTSTASSDSGAARLPDVPPVPDAPDSRGVPDPEAPDTADTGHETEAGAEDGEGNEDEGAEIVQAPLPPILLDPGHRSSEAERTAFRALAGDMWDRHGAAVARALARMPALRGKEQEAARADLIALRMYLHLSEGPFSHGALTWSLRDRELDLLPYGACVASALNRMPSYRGAVLRGTTASGDGGRPGPPRPGTLLRDAALLSTVRLDAGTAPPPGDSYVIWSVAGRRVRQFSEQRGPEEVVFAPGTLFRVLAVRRAQPGVQIHLRELTGPAGALAPDPEGDRAVLARLEAVAAGPEATPKGTGHWPERCAGAVGAGP
ncbi:hypothetical protein SGL43_01513 [Streptomyces globisporus]|uniref:NAD(+)--protein-arginine ADP-ribosyltransferase n=1 Tax=Streptomyces globisporus TaxID=1908 RepID=A0ABN8V075_STRGL|nr:hypothetical protein [Streptomyces globisporus]WSQ94310.1 hypothetical protein OG425_24490 [Streptomyces globisporus]CAH9414509.1 hypothetical protein SGL43_01513 [Streptomyces globisporus]